jgi:hypothetical protein
MFSHTAYGLGISCPFPLPELLPASLRQDVLVRLDSLTQDLPNDVKGAEPNGSARDAVLCWNETGTFFVRNGNEIVINPAPHVQEPLLRSFLLGPVLAVLLRQRGFLVLHASAVALDRQVMLFPGGSGWGKSTLAAALCQQGAQLLSDDVTTIDMNQNRLVVIPGYPQLKLWPNSARALGLDPEGLPKLHDGTDKRVWRTGFEFCSEPLPLGRVYVLSDGPVLQVTDLEPQAALVELVRHSARVRELHPDHAPRHLRQCAALVNSVPVSRLTAPRAYSALSAVARVVAQEALHAVA